ncbi:MAG: glycosyltransferase [Thermoplasmatales archaeon]
MNIVQIPPCVDPNIYRKGKKSPDPCIIYFRGLRKYKRPEEVIRVFNDLVAQIHTLKLTVVDSSSEPPSFRELVNSYNLDDRVTFTERVTDKILAAKIAKSWLNIHASVTESWGYSIIEAPAEGTPTVAYSVPSVVDAIEDCINGIKLKDGDRKALTDAAMKILSSPETWWVSCVKIGEKYSWDKTSRLWDETIKKVLEK